MKRKHSYGPSATRIIGLGFALYFLLFACFIHGFHTCNGHEHRDADGGEGGNCHGWCDHASPGHGDEADLGPEFKALENGHEFCLACLLLQASGGTVQLRIPVLATGEARGPGTRPLIEAPRTRDILDSSSPRAPPAS